MPFEVVASSRVMALCRRYDVSLLVAVRPETLRGVGELVRACARAEVPLGLWPMLDDAQGRWANARNVAVFGEFAERVARAAGGRTELALDLEPPIAELRAALRPELGALGRARRGLSGARAAFAEAERSLHGLATRLIEGGATLSAAAVPLVLLDEAPRALWQTLLGTPVDALPLGHVSVMLYTSLLEGWSRGALGREDARGLLLLAAERARERFGERAGVSLGAVGLGALGDEPTYRSAAELADDVATARAAGVDDLTLLDLGGLLGRPPPEAWLEAFVEPEPARGAVTLRARLAMASLRSGTAVINRIWRP